MSLDINSKKTLDEKKIVNKLLYSSIIGNTLLSAFKLIAGILGHSGAMISDSVHSFSDVITTFIAGLGVKLSKKAADKDHPYGHERLECIASLILSAILLITGIMIGKSGLENIFSGDYSSLKTPGLIALIAAIVSIAVKEAMYWYTKYYAALISSSAFMADAWHHRSDALSSVGSLIGIGGAMLGFPIMDSIASVIICVFILKVSIDILRDSIEKMLDTSCGEKYEKEMSDYISLKKDVVCVDLLHTRKFGNKVYVDLEIQVDGTKTLNEAHKVAEEIHTDIEQKFPEVKHIMIHLNPASLD